MLGLIMTAVLPAQAGAASTVREAPSPAIGSGQSEPSPSYENANCRSNECPSLRAASYNAADLATEVIPAGGALPTEAKDAQPDGESMALMDVGLMLLFACGLLAYPLVRKQRALRHSLVFASYI
jgi:hypothetical protein